MHVLKNTHKINVQYVHNDTMYKIGFTSLHLDNASSYEIIFENVNFLNMI